MHHTLRRLPQIQSLVTLPSMALLVEQYSHEEVVASLRSVIEQLRSDLLAEHPVDIPDFKSPSFAISIALDVERIRKPSLRPVINATGVIIHTNLGRAPLAHQAVVALQAASTGSSNLEFDLETGKRGSRHTHVEDLICRLTGAEAAVVVNNCAAAVMLGLMVTATGHSVVASRGELIEIGGAYRLPDVIVQSGATLREVGTTNKTRLSDYEHAIDDTTAVLLKSHTSNFQIIGFTSAPERSDLAELAKQHGVILMEDLGSGVLIDLSPYGMGDEPVVSDILKAGVDVVMFSGDKLLGGPQAGIIAGKREIIAKLKSHPLMRAVRVDKLSLAALEATLRLYLPPYNPVAEIPVLRMLAETVTAVEQRAKHLANDLGKLGPMEISVESSIARVGAGALPERDLESYTVSVKSDVHSPNALGALLRQNTPPIIGRIERDHLLLDMRTVADQDLPAIVSAFEGIVGA
ncbi:L-seryl-tRNA(Sec) selenium transferase [Sulfitobacter sp.]|uniref:L-seryl-tRNA(Sec) selenium transferase n=1 Tax=Sulfitobacter sp. TaxID=1903071 RepID=UPI00300164FF